MRFTRNKAIRKASFHCFVGQMLGNESKSTFLDMVLFTYSGAILFIIKAKNVKDDATSNESFPKIVIFAPIHLEDFNFGIKKVSTLFLKAGKEVKYI